MTLLGKQFQDEFYSTLNREVAFDVAENKTPGIRRHYEFTKALERFAKRVKCFPKEYQPLTGNLSSRGYMLAGIPLEVGDILNVKMDDQVIEFVVLPRRVDTGRTTETYPGKFHATKLGFSTDDIPVGSDALFLGSMHFKQEG